MEKKKKTKKKGTRIVAWVLLTMLALVLISAGGVYFYINHKLDKISYTPAGTATPPPFTEEERQTLLEEQAKEEIPALETSETPPEGEVSQDKDVVNILLLGTDMRIPYTADPGRADAIQVISLNLSTGAIKLISFERGIMVPVPDHGTDLLTHAYRWAGPDYMQSIFQDYFLLDVAGYAQVDFDTFKQIIDALGGIDIELTALEAWAINEDVGSRLTEGMNHLDGELALKYCRLRKIDSNWVRVERQRKVIQEILYKTKGLSLTELNDLADVILPLVHTNLTKNQISSLLLSATKFLGATADQMTVPDRSAGRCDFQVEAERLRVFIYGEEA